MSRVSSGTYGRFLNSSMNANIFLKDANYFYEIKYRHLMCHHNQAWINTDVCGRKKINSLLLKTYILVYIEPEYFLGYLNNN